MTAKRRLAITIPAGVTFADLQLHRDPRTGSISFRWEPIERICRASGLDVSLFRDTHEENVSQLLVAWYFEHLARGGELDPVQQELIDEVLLENAHGEGISHEPGQA